MKLGDDMEDSVVEEKIKAQRPEHCALLVYTVRYESNYNVYSLKLIQNLMFPPLSSHQCDCGSLEPLEIPRVSCLAMTTYVSS